MALDRDIAGLLFANETFYRAFLDKDMALMNAVWSMTAPVSCLHPGWPPIDGRDAVLQSWHAILSGPNSPSIECLGAHANLYGDMGIVICYERIGSEYLLATNVYIRGSNGWLIIHHQSSPAPEPGEHESTPSRRIN